MKPCLLSISVAAIMASFNCWADLEHARANGNTVQLSANTVPPTSFVGGIRHAETP